MEADSDIEYLHHAFEPQTLRVKPLERSLCFFKQAIRWFFVLRPAEIGNFLLTSRVPQQRGTVSSTRHTTPMILGSTASLTVSERV